MTSLKRKYAAIERELVRALTDACERAKAEIPGFEWLTHRVNYDRFPGSLVVTWVFDSEASLRAAMAGPQKARMHDLTMTAFGDIGIDVSDIAAHVEWDSEERCAATHSGDWAARLHSRQRSEGKHGQRH